MKVEDLSSQGAWSGLSALGFVVLSEWWQSWAELQPVCQRGPQTCSVPLEIIFFFGSVTNTIHICLKKKKNQTRDACSFQRAVTSPRVSSAAAGLGGDGLDLKGKSA